MRKFRELKYPLIAAAVAAVPVYYLVARHAARSGFAAAQAEWDASAVPFKFTDTFPAAPVVPPEKDMLDGDFFGELRVKSGERGNAPGPMVDWYDAMSRPGGRSRDYRAWILDWDTAFSPTAKAPAKLKEVPGESRAETLVRALEADFPDLKNLPARLAERPEVDLRLRVPSPTAISLDSDNIHFLRSRRAVRILLSYAGAKLQTGDVDSAFAASEMLTAYIGALTRSPLLHNPIIGHQFLKWELRLHHALLESGLMDESRLAQLDSRLAAIRPLETDRRAIAQDVVVCARYWEAHGFSPTGTFIPDNVSWGDWRDWDARNRNLAILYASPVAWSIAPCVDELRGTLRYLEAVSPGGDRLDLAAADRYNPSADPEIPWQFMAAWGFGVGPRTLFHGSAHQAALHCARLSVALERHRLRHGALPAGLAGLDADLLPGGKIPVGPIYGLPPEYTVSPDGGYTLSYRNEDATDASPGKAPTTSRDVAWTVAPRKR